MKWLVVNVDCFILTGFKMRTECSVKENVGF